MKCTKSGLTTLYHGVCVEGGGPYVACLLRKSKSDVRREVQSSTAAAVRVPQPVEAPTEGNGLIKYHIYFFKLYVLPVTLHSADLFFHTVLG